MDFKIKINLIQAEKKKELIDLSIPSNWEKDQPKDFMLFPLSSLSEEYIELNKRFLTTLPNATIKNITRIQNLNLWKNFCFAKHQLVQKGNSTQLELFHGTKKTDPEIIYGGKEEGFDMRFSNQGMWGIGCYFHKNAIYSHGYRYTKDRRTFIMLVAYVLVGNSKQLQSDSSLRLPPFIEGRNTDRYDSVMSGDGIYIIYNNQRAYSAYIIEYNIL